MADSVYVLTYSQGEYSDWTLSVLGVYASEEAGNHAAAKLAGLVDETPETTIERDPETGRSSVNYTGKTNRRARYKLSGLQLDEYPVLESGETPWEATR